MQKIIDDIKLVIDKVSALDLTTAEYGHTDIVECPLCQGDGEVSRSSYTNVDDLPLNIDVNGIGECVSDAEKYLISVSPEKIKDLLKYIDSLEDEVLFLEDQL